MDDAQSVGCSRESPLATEGIFTHFGSDVDNLPSTLYRPW
jgi:hypothetical protein